MDEYKICPKCKSEFRPEISECPECRVPLELARDRCPHCGSDSYAGGRCAACGYLDRESLSMLCFSHPTKKARWACTVCGRPLCSKCAFRSGDGSMKCEEHSGIESFGDSVAIYKASPTEVGILAVAMIMNGLEVTFSPEGSASSCRSCTPSAVKVLVHKRLMGDAEALLDSLLFCGACKKVTPQNARVCPHCGESFES